MDANGTRFHLIMGERDWGVCTVSNGVQLSEAMKPGLEVDPVSDKGLGWDNLRQEVTLRPMLMKFKHSKGDNRPAIEDRRGAASDRFGNWYWISETKTEILVNSAGSGLTTHFWSTTDMIKREAVIPQGEFHPVDADVPSTPVELGGLSVTEDHFLIAGTIKPAGLLVFDLHAGGPPQQIVWPDNVPFDPFDMAPRSGGGVWVLDRKNRNYWSLDRRLNVLGIDQTLTEVEPPVGEDFQSQVETEESRKKTKQQAEVFPSGIPISAASPVSASDPISIEGLPDGTVLILDSGSETGVSAIMRYKYGKQLGKAFILETPEPTAYDIAFVPEDDSTEGTVSDRLYMVSPEGNQTYAFEISVDEEDNLHLDLQNDYYPMRLFGGKGLVAAGTKVYYDFGTGWIPLVGQRRLKYALEGTFETRCNNLQPPFDGREQDCVWHRLMIDAHIPPGTGIMVRSRASNDSKQLLLSEWQDEPTLHLRVDGSELPYVKNSAAKERGTWELLFQRAVGRYLQLQITLTGEGKSTPSIRAMRIYYPRFSYLHHYLPAVYREDEESALFLDRFLANFEGTYTALEDKIASAQLLFDARSAPTETLEWLASWLGVSLDPKWDESRRRLFIKYAMTFFQYRGTIRGLQFALRLALDECFDETVFTKQSPGEPYYGGVRIVERFRTRKSPGVLLGDPTEITGPRTVAKAQRWQPSQGRDSLQKAYREKLGESDTDALPLKSAPEGRQTDWKNFMTESFGFVPSATTGDETLWREFLLRRYQQPSRLIEAYKNAGQYALGSFSEAVLPDGLPADGPPLFDWYQFQASVLAMHQVAHRFTVLIPLSKTDLEDVEIHRQRLELAQRIINLEKPAHTIFDVKFYWALFRVGMARLGSDTLLDVGSRSPYLVSPLILGQGYLLGSYLDPGSPQNASDRQVLGRDPLRK